MDDQLPAAARAQPGKRPTDLELLWRYYNGDDEAFGELHKRCTGQLYARFRRLLFGPEDAEDLTIEVWARISLGRLPGHPRLDLERSWWAYLSTVATNVARDTWRHRKRRPVETPAGGPSDEDDDGPGLAGYEAPGLSPEELVVLRIQLVDCLNALAPAARRMLQLRFDSVSYRDIAILMNRAQGGIASGVHRARARVKECLESAGDSPTD